jgi:hypothetical protein
MTGARPLKDVFADLLGGGDGARPDPEAALAAAGHPDLPPELVAEAVVSYADTAPVEVAEHLSPYVIAHSGVPTVEETVADSGGEALVPDLATLGDLLADASAGPDVDLDGPDGPGVDVGGLDATVGDPPALSLDALDDLGGFAPAGPQAELLDDDPDVAALARPEAGLDFGGGAPDPTVAERAGASVQDPGDGAVDEDRPDVAALPTEPDADDVPPADLSLPRPDDTDDGTDPDGLDDDPAAGLDA